MKFLLAVFFIVSSYTGISGQENFLGENFNYRLTFLGIPTVDVSAAVPETLTINGQSVFHVDIVARTTELFSPYYTLENRYHTYISTLTGLPVKFTKDINQRTLQQRGEIDYDQTEGTAVYEGGRFTSQIRKSIQKDSHNLFSLIYFLRRNPLSVGQQQEWNLDVESEPWKVKTEVMAKEFVSAADSLFESYKVSLRFFPVKELIKRKHTDIVTRRVATPDTRINFWIGTHPPYPFLKIESEMFPFNTYTTMVRK